MKPTSHLVLGACALAMALQLPYSGTPALWQAGLAVGAAFADDDDDDDAPRRAADRDDDDDDDGARPAPRPTAPRPVANDDDDDDARPAPRPTAPRPVTRDDDDDDAPGARPRVGPLVTPRVEAPAAQPAPPRRQQAAPPAPRPAPPPPERAPDEIVALELSDADLALLLARGYSVIEERAVPRIDTIVRRLRVPGDVTVADARDAIRALPSGQDADFNHYYRSEQEIAPAADAGIEPASAAPGARIDGALPPRPCEGLHCPAFTQIGWPVAPSRELTCGQPVAIGMIDTGLNPEHATFADARLEVVQLSDEALDPSRAVHGTAVAALLIGDPASRSPGLVPYARVVAIDVFNRVAADERADVFNLVDALGLLASQDVRVINLSLAGPPNTVLEETITRLVTESGIVIVAAAGNGGPLADPAYPAAYDHVIAVTAIDANDAVYRRAQQGDYIDIAAPGVEVWTAASISGARSKTGTSFAAPFVSAAAALILQEYPDLTPVEVRERLFSGARDLGDPGTDPVFGHGALRIADVCAGGL